MRAACFIGELDVPYSEEFDGHDFGATHVIAYVGDEPVGTVRVRWFQSFAMPERLAVIQRFRGHDIGQLLLERCRTLAESRGCNMLYTQVLPTDVKYWEKQGWRRLVAEEASSGAKRIVAMVRAVDPSKPLPEAEAPESVVLRREAAARRLRPAAGVRYRTDGKPAGDASRGRRVGWPDRQPFRERPVGARLGGNAMSNVVRRRKGGG